MNVLCFNPGSSTLRHRLVAMDPEREIAGAMVDDIRGGRVAEVAAQVFHDCPHEVDGLAFRVVHGGDRFQQPTRIDESLLREPESLSHLAPLHLPTDIDVIRAVTAAADCPAVAVLDTAFHQTLPEAAYRYPLPLDLDDDLRRYGFHGLAHSFVTDYFTRQREQFDHAGAAARLISLHFGGGVSACAIRDGQSVATTMGMTPLDGMMMGTRSGSLDPGLVLELIRRGKSVDEVSELLNRHSGLLGVSGISQDLRQLHPAADAGSHPAQLALQMYDASARQAVGAYIALLGGCDAVLLSGPVAENSTRFRGRVLQGLECLGIEIDAARNEAAGPDRAARISTDQSQITVVMIPANEELQLARAASSVLAQ